MYESPVHASVLSNEFSITAFLRDIDSTASWAVAIVGCVYVQIGGVLLFLVEDLRRLSVSSAGGAAHRCPNPFSAGAV